MYDARALLSPTGNLGAEVAIEFPAHWTEAQVSQFARALDFRVYINGEGPRDGRPEDIREMGYRLFNFGWSSTRTTATGPCSASARSSSSPTTSANRYTYRSRSCPRSITMRARARTSRSSGRSGTSSACPSTTAGTPATPSCSKRMCRSLSSGAATSSTGRPSHSPVRVHPPAQPLKRRFPLFFSSLLFFFWKKKSSKRKSRDTGVAKGDLPGMPLLLWPFPAFFFLSLSFSFSGKRKEEKRRKKEKDGKPVARVASCGEAGAMVR